MSLEDALRRADRWTAAARARARRSIRERARRSSATKRAAATWQRRADIMG